MKSTQLPLVSVIVPIYNGEPYIENCIASILSQNYKNIEIIIVNDGSTDKSEEICLGLAEKNSCIRYFYQKNGGVAVARNFGISVANGQYIAFVDCDDTIEPPIYTKMLRIAMQDGSDIVFDGMKCCNSKQEVFYDDTFPISDGKYSGQDIINLFLLPMISRGRECPFKQPANNGSACICLFRAEFLNNLPFPCEAELSLAEDMIFQLYALRKAKTVSKVSGSHYLYYSSRDHLSRSRVTAGPMLERRLSIMPALEKFAAENSDIEKLDEYMATRYVREISHCMFTDTAFVNGVAAKHALIKKYLQLDQLTASIKKIYGYQRSLKFKLLMFLLKYKLSFILTLYIIIK